MLGAGTAERVRLVNLPSEVVCPGWSKPVGLLFLDGDHRYDAVRRDLDCWLEHLTPDAAVALDDSTDPELGPIRLVAEADRYGLTVDRVVGKVTVLRRRPIGGATSASSS